MNKNKQLDEMNFDLKDDKIFRKIIIENEYMFDDIVRKDVPDFDEMMCSVMKSADDIITSGHPYEFNVPYETNFNRKKKTSPLHKTLLPIAAVLVIVLMSFSLSMWSVDASKLKIFNAIIEFKDGWFTISSVDEDRTDREYTGIVDAGLNTQFFYSAEEALSKIDRPFFLPEYMPDGYSLFSIQYESDKYDNYSIQSTYKNIEDEILRIDQRKYDETSTITENRFRADILKDRNVYWVISGDIKHVFWYEEIHEIYMIVSVNDGEIIKIIQNMKLKSR